MLSPDQQQELLDNIVEEFTGLLRQGKRPSIGQYKQQHPSISEEIEELLTSVAMIEELKTQSATVSDSIKNEMKKITRLERVGDYRIIRELGRGGMGVVFEAIHESLGRRVAIKVMPNRKFDDQKYLERFRREAQAAANLHHTNIVSVFGIGQAGEHHYYVMEFVDGESLSNILKRLNSFYESNTEDGLAEETVEVGNEKRSPDEFELQQTLTNGVAKKFNSPKERYRWAAQIGAQLADGLAYAHGLGMLHRDVKPANLLIDKNETVWLTDFGLVKNISNQSITKTGDIIGTPQYMAPESFEGKYDQRSETYCLGLTVYEMATLRPAFENASTPELIRRITTESPVPPNKLEKRIPRDLNRIIQKAISKEPSYRYQSAAEMRDDLRAFLDDRPVTARKISLVENMWRWSRRNPGQAVLSFLTALMLITIAIGATMTTVITKRLYDESEQRLLTLNIEERRTAQALRLAEDAMDVTVQFYDKLFRSIVFKDSENAQDLSLDGFGDLEGVSGTIKESDAEVLDEMMQFYLNFAKSNEFQSNLQLKSLAAFSHRRVANIYHLMGEFEKAESAYDQAIYLFDVIRSSEPTNGDATLNLVRTLNESGRAFELTGSFNDRKKADGQYARAIELLRRELDQENGINDSVIRTELAKSLLLKGSPIVDFRLRAPKRFQDINYWGPENPPMGRRNENRGFQSFRVLDARQSKREIEEALEITNELIVNYSGRQVSRMRSISQSTIRSVLDLAVGNWRKAKISYEFSKFKLGKLLEDYPENEELRFIQAVGLTRLGAIQLATRNFGDSRESLKNAAMLMNDLVESNRNNPEYKFLLAQIKAIGYSNENVSRSTRGINSLNASKEILIGLVARFDNNLDYRRMLADVCLRLALLQKRADGDAAGRNLVMANEMYSQLIFDTPRNRPIQIRAMQCLMHYVDLVVEQGEYSKAIATIEKLLSQDSVLDMSGQNWPRSSDANRKAILYRMLAISYSASGDVYNSLESEKKALSLISKIRSRPPGRNNRRNRPPSLFRAPN